MMIIMYAMGIVVAALFGLYIYRRSGKQMRFYGKDPLSKKARIGRLIFAAAVCLPCIKLFSAWPLITLVVIVVFALTDLAAFICRHVFKEHKDASPYKAMRWLYRSGLIAVIVMAIYFGYGIYNMGRIVPAHYEITASDHISQDYKVVVISDTHYGTIQDESMFLKEVKKINKIKPDVVLLNGDITEEGTTYANMKKFYKAAGGIKAKYGTYYIYGNHDKQHYTDNKSYSISELEKTITSNGIKIMEDRSVKIGKDMLLIGRKDYSEPDGRNGIKTLIKEAPMKDPAFILVADHQPRQMDASAKAGVDLQVSGHTHGGHVFPLGTLFDIVGYENYGEYTHGKMKLIVTSGFAGWGYPFRTQRHCEYAVIDIKNK